jgi:hypothetical protein
MGWVRFWFGRSGGKLGEKDEWVGLTVEWISVLIHRYCCFQSLDCGLTLKTREKEEKKKSARRHKGNAKAG